MSGNYTQFVDEEGEVLATVDGILPVPEDERIGIVNEDHNLIYHEVVSLSIVIHRVRGIPGGGSNYASMSVVMRPSPDESEDDPKEM